MAESNTVSGMIDNVLHFWSFTYDSTIVDYLVEESIMFDSCLDLYSLTTTG